MKKIGAQQPFFLPDFYFFLKLYSSDRFVIADFLKFRKQSSIVRVLLPVAQGSGYLSVPVVHDRENPQQPIRMVQIREEIAWRKRHLQTLASLFRKYPYFDFYYPGLETVYMRAHPSLSVFLTDLIRWQVEQLFPEKKVIIASEEGITDRGAFASWLKQVGEFEFIIHPFESGYYQEQFGGIPQRVIVIRNMEKFPSAYHPRYPVIQLLFMRGPDIIFHFIENSV